MVMIGYFAPICQTNYVTPLFDTKFIFYKLLSAKQSENCRNCPETRKYANNYWFRNAAKNDWALESIRRASGQDCIFADLNL
jgi:hypothetical protein